MSQLFEDGKIITVDDFELECVGISYQETDGVRHSFSYIFRPKVEVDLERRKAEEPNPIKQLEINKEETLNVK